MFGRFGKWLLGALVIAVMFIIGLYSSYHSYFSPADAPQEKYHSLAQTATKKIAIIDVSGAIMEGEDSFVKKQIDRVREDDRCGRRRAAHQFARRHGHRQRLSSITTCASWLKERKLPIVVSMGSVCASGGYYVAMAVGDQPDSIFAEPTTWTGSIGVIIPHFDLSGVLGEAGQSRTTRSPAARSSRWARPRKPMTEEERKMLQELVDESFKGFKEIVVSGRPKFKDDPAALDAVATGQIFTAKQALERGLVDKIGFIEDAIARAAELAGENADDRALREIRRAADARSARCSAPKRACRRTRQRRPVGMLDLATPRAYYLWSWLPAAMSNSDRIHHRGTEARRRTNASIAVKCIRIRHAFMSFVFSVLLVLCD